jgi:hypothetical protein
MVTDKPTFVLLRKEERLKVPGPAGNQGHSQLFYLLSYSNCISEFCIRITVGHCMLSKSDVHRHVSKCFH